MGMRTKSAVAVKGTTTTRVGKAERPLQAPARVRRIARALTPAPAARGSDIGGKVPAPQINEGRLDDP
jgi:2-keto-3-deoxy-galactonokinase